MVSSSFSSSSLSSSSSSSLAASRSQGTYAYDVFLSFRGFDTREGFTSHLFETLKHHGINTFIDNEGLGKGERIDKLFEYIHVSEIFVVIFSENYGNSTWCLREISTIINSGRWIIPVFVNVDPSNIRKQGGAFGAAFNEKMHDQNPEDIRNWREALNFAGNLSGYVLEEQGNEDGVIELIAKDVVRRVKKPLDVAKHPVSIVSRVEEVLQLISEDKEEKVSILTIAGVGGLGKSTLARGLHNNLMRNFDACCFLMNVRQTTLEKGLVYLQEKLVRGIQKLEQDPSVDNLDEGKLRIRRAVTAKKVLLILDDVDDKDQLEALAAERRWFSKGSIVIITTRNRSIVVEHYQSDDCLLYEPRGLAEEESMRLFSLHAFLADKPPPKFEKITMDLVRAARGLPLALTVYGSHLFPRKDIEYWREFLKELKKIPYGKIVESLKLSYDNLKDNEKRVFLDIAKFYVGEETKYPMYIWEACGLFPKLIVQTLVERSLIRVEKQYNRHSDKVDHFWMHDHVKDMANYIISQESRGSTPRVITKEDELRNLMDRYRREETCEHIEGIFICDDRYYICELSMNNRTFDAMPNLQLLRLKGGGWGPDDDDDSRTSPRFPSDLKWLEWKGCCGIKMFPWDDLNLTHLTILDLSLNSYLSGFKSTKRSSMGEPSLLHGLPRQLRVLNLSWCDVLEELPDLRRCLKLVELHITGCRRLRNIDGSNIFHLHSLTHFDLSDCCSLETLPALPGSLVALPAYGCRSLTTISNLSNLVNLEKLDFRCCINLRSLPGLQELILLRGKELIYYQNVDDENTMEEDV